MPTQEQVDAAEAIEQALKEAELEYERPRPDAFLVTLPGERKLKTLVWLNIGRHSLLIKSFFCRRPDENEGEFYRYLMRRNSDMYGMAFTADDVATCTSPGGCRWPGSPAGSGPAAGVPSSYLL